jgi:hypothetical protein
VHLSEKEGPVMTGSFLVPIITPIVALIAMATWLGIVYWADAHPGWKSRAPHGPELTDAGVLPPEAEPGETQDGELVPPSDSKAA